MGCRLQLIWKATWDIGLLVAMVPGVGDSMVGDTSPQGMADCSPPIKNVDRAHRKANWKVLTGVLRWLSYQPTMRLSFYQDDGVHLSDLGAEFSSWMILVLDWLNF